MREHGSKTTLVFLPADGEAELFTREGRKFLKK